MTLPDAEVKALAWIENMRRCLEADVSAGKIPHPSAIHTHLSEIHRFLTEFCCPTHCSQMREALTNSLNHTQEHQ